MLPPSGCFGDTASCVDAHAEEGYASHKSAQERRLQPCGATFRPQVPSLWLSLRHLPREALTPARMCRRFWAPLTSPGESPQSLGPARKARERQNAGGLRPPLPYGDAPVQLSLAHKCSWHRAACGRLVARSALRSSGSARVSGADSGNRPIAMHQ